MAARKGRRPANKPSAKPKSRSKKVKVKQLTPAETAARAAPAGPTFSSKVSAKLSGYADKLLEQAEQDPDKLIAGAAQLLNNTERLVAAVKGDPEGAKRALRNGVVSLAASLMRSARERAGAA